MTELSGNAEAESSAIAQSDWWSSGDPRVNPDVRVNTPATASAVLQSDPAPDLQALSARPATAGIRVQPQTAHIALLLSGALIIIGSVTSWVTIAIFGHSISASGTDGAISNAITINGWLTFVLGILVVLLAGLMMVSDASSLRVLALASSAATVGFSVYFFVRILHEISKADNAANKFAPLARQLRVNEHIGWGLVVLVVAAVAGLASAIAAMRSN